MIEYSDNRNSSNSILKKKEQYAKYNMQTEIKKLTIEKIKLSKIKKNLLFKETNNFKINSKKLFLNNTGDSIFSNVELKKHINDNNKINIHNGTDYLISKFENRNNNELIGDNNTSNYNKGSKIVNKKELKEESTNTFFNYININENNKYEYETQGIISLDSNSNNTREMQIIHPKTSLHNSNNNNINLGEYGKVLLNDTKNNLASNSNNIKNISFNNTIIFNKEANKNNNNFFLELYNFNLLQSIIQKRSVFFDFKKKNLFGTQVQKSAKPINLTLFLNQQNNNKLSLRELYRNLNKQNDSFNLLRIKLKKKNKMKKKRIETNDSNSVKKQKIIFERNNKYNLMNVQYNLNKTDKNKYKKMNNIFQRTLFSKRIPIINNQISKIKIKKENQDKNLMKTSINFQNNLFKKKNQQFIYDELDKGLTNSSSQIKTFLNKHLKKLNTLSISKN